MIERLKRHYKEMDAEFLERMAALAEKMKAVS